MFIWPITKAVGDHYLLPGALTARSARARTERNKLGYAAPKREMCRKGWTGKQENRRREGDRIQTDIMLQPHFIVWERYDRMDPKRRTLRKRCLTNVLCLLPTILYCYVYLFCGESRDFAGDCKFCRHWGSNRFLSAGCSAGWWTCSQSEAVWECHSEYRSVGLCDVRIMAPPRKRLWAKRLWK